MKKYLFLILCLFASADFLIHHAEIQSVEIENKDLQTDVNRLPLSINIIANKNGVGWDQDVDVLMSALTGLGHDVAFVKRGEKRQKNVSCRQADVNIFIERVNKEFFPFAEKNYLLPNAEWLTLSPDEVAQGIFYPHNMLLHRCSSVFFPTMPLYHI